MSYPYEPANVTPPTPNLDREEPEMWLEEDIPSDDEETGME